MEVSFHDSEEDIPQRRVMMDEIIKEIKEDWVTHVESIFGGINPVVGLPVVERYLRQAYKQGLSEGFDEGYASAGK